MTVLGIAYSELYSGDPASAVAYFTESLGFAEEAASRTEDAHSVLLRQGEVRIVVTSGPRTEEFLASHGDGIADIAFVCDDAAATRERALAAGAVPVPASWGQTAVSGFGDVRHTLLEPRLPFPGPEWKPAPATGVSPPGRIRLLDHVAVCLEAGTMPDTTRFYLEGFGLTRYSTEYIEFAGQAMDSLVVRSASGGATFTLLEPDPAKGSAQLDGFLLRNGGAGVQHLAFLVDAIVPAVRHFRAHGTEFLSTPGTYYEALSERLPDMREEIADLRDAQVLADRDEWGHLLQLFTRSPYEHNTLFYELVQRRGARGFGSSNIKALYEAIERDRLAAS